MLPVQLTLLRSRVARRVAGLFVLCGVAPLAVLALVTTWSLTGYLRQAEAARLRSVAKTTAMDAAGRLIAAEEALRLVMSVTAALPSRASLPGVLALVRLDPDGDIEPGFGELDPPTLDGPARERLAKGDSVLLPPVRPYGPLLLLVPLPSSVRAGAVAVAALDPRDVWGLDDLPSDGLAAREVCGVIGDDVVLACAESLVPAPMIAAVLRDAPGAGTLALHVDDREWMAAHWSAPLRAHFSVPRWTAVVLTRSDEALAPARATIRQFVLAFVATLCAALLVSLHQIRRQLDPIARLSDATARLARGDFDARVAIASGDELEDLGDAFNRMAGDLQAQFVRLRELSVGTLEALARTIDAKSPWTAGHSTRVTRVALLLARRMGLDERACDRIRRGGLLHDIGKIGIPASILDKPGPLTPAERAAMKEHASLGARILEPLPHCADILPIVRQHHERLDGSGYPEGLAGYAISADARLLAVADVFDAMTSERPYRAGLPPVQAVAYIAASAGRSFDPAVVAALVAELDAGGLAVEASALPRERTA